MDILVLFTIKYNFTNGPFGGGNQFLKALRNELCLRNIYTDNLELANVIIYNGFFSGKSSEFYDELFIHKLKYREKIFIHRIDGLLWRSRSNENEKLKDQLTAEWSNLVSDGIVFQSHFSKNQQMTEKFFINKPYAIIGNAPDKGFFFIENIKINKKAKYDIIYTSWSSNIKKGFDTLLYLDKTLDFNKYNFRFVGNIPKGIQLKNIHIIPAQPSNILGSLLRSSDIFLSLSHEESYSNAIIEAMHSGLPVLIRNSGANAELVPYGAILYDKDEDIAFLIKKILNNYTYYKQNTRPQSIENITDKYIKFSKNIKKCDKKYISIDNYIRIRKKFSKIVPFSIWKHFFYYILKRIM